MNYELNVNMKWIGRLGLLDPQHVFLSLVNM